LIQTDASGTKMLEKSKIDGFVKSPLGPLIVIPAKEGIQAFQAIMDSCLRRNDAIFDFLRFRQDLIVVRETSLLSVKILFGQQEE